MSRDPSRRWDSINGELWLKYMVTQPVRQPESGGRGAMTHVQGDIASQDGGPLQGHPPPDNLQVSPIGLVPKKQPGYGQHLGKHAEEFRLIHYLSYPRGKSINDFIDTEACSVVYARFDEATHMVQQLGKGALLAKFDIQSAFRIIPVHPSDFELLGIRFEGGTAGTSHCSDNLNGCVNTLEQLGVPIAHDKTVGPTTKLTFLGLEIDTIAMQIRIPESKIKEATREIQDILSTAVFRRSGWRRLWAYMQGKWFNGAWPPQWVTDGTTRDLTLLELFPITLAIQIWGKQLANKKVLFYCDNQAVVTIINKQSTKAPRVMSLLRRLILQCLRYNIMFKAKYVCSTANTIADALSRFQLKRFREAAPAADQNPTPIPCNIWLI
ncbi:uncharacterized protein [Haliotis cracherodii]|uniref:uncharacterized protein n=1 Tax=Haliotis cracherodii TaxID=6455 RepID=UPI0039E9656E